MARRLGILAAHQRDLQPREFRHKTYVQGLVRRCVADWIVFNVLARRRPVREFPQALPPPRLESVGPYIPGKLPPVELPGLIWQPPKTSAAPVNACGR